MVLPWWSTLSKSEPGFEFSTFPPLTPSFVMLGLLYESEFVASEFCLVNLSLSLCLCVHLCVHVCVSNK